MFQGRSVGVVIPAYNEERHIAQTLASVPDYVDSVVVVDDCSTDNTWRAASNVKRPGLTVLRGRVNEGVGGAIVRGYQELKQQGLEVAVVMAGDGQMDPQDLPALLAPLVADEADYCKGNRLYHRDTPRVMPGWRFAGNATLSVLTRASAGYRDIVDSQCGYTALRLALLDRLELDRIYPRYGFPNDFLAHLHSAGARVAQVEVRPVYEGQKTGIKPVQAVFALSYVLIRSYILRISREGPGGRK
jgi:glycosyltransferase involved in cell wall biosynthesis